MKRSFRPSYQVRSASNATETAPNSKAYIESGAIAGAQNLVDVKKVLVIGSGGLAIGQAGEFDYSGKFWNCTTLYIRCAPSHRVTGGMLDIQRAEH